MTPVDRPSMRAGGAASGGIVAIRGFDYQSSVILDRLFAHFDAHGAGAAVRPEGEDDLDLMWTEANVLRRVFAQVKKPREDATGGRTGRAWSIADAATELMPGTLLRIAGNSAAQVWVLGDDLEPDLEALLAAGAAAPAKATQPYWSLAHAMVRPEVLKGLDEPSRRSLGQWRVPDALPPEPERALDELTRTFGSALDARHVGGLAQRYGDRLREVHVATSGVLGRVTADAGYGTEEEVKVRVLDRLRREYGLPAVTVEHTLFRNLRGFIQDISKQPGRSFDRIELELELRSVLPGMSPLRDPPTLPPDHVPRPDVIDALGGPAVVVEVTGVSGGGKSILAAEFIARGRHAGQRIAPFYAEAPPEVTLRSVLAGVAFHLRRLGHPKAFEAAVGSTDADDTFLENLARSLGEVGHPLSLVIDMVQGRAGPVMAAQLAGLVRRRALGPLRIVLLAQERVLTALSVAELAAAGVTHLDLRGLTFEEFVTLAAHHGHSDRLSLHAVYETLTSGRITGLPPQFASTLARLVSVVQMLDIVRLPAEDRLAEADRRRFDGVSVAARGAAERLVCFAVPFSRSDAEEAFGEERVGAALADLTSLGLVARRSDMFEMHELVRAGIEASLAPSVRLDAHRRLAEWAETRVLVGARIHHLVRSGQQAAANDAARTAFLHGEAWDIVASYVAEHRLVTAEETVDAYLANQARDAGHWLLPDVLRSLGDPSAAGMLFDRVQRAGLSLLADYGRGFPVLEAILALSPERLKPLMELCLLSPGDARMRVEAVGLLTLARFRKERRLDDDALAFILDLPERQRALFAPLLWVDGRRDSLRAALRLGRHRTDDTRRREDPSTWLRLDSEADVVEFLAALPFVEPGLLLARRAVGLHEQSSILEAQRDPLSLHAPALCTSAAVEPLVRAQALRVLVFLAHPALESAALALTGLGGPAGMMAAIAPALAPGSFRREPIEARVDDQSAEWPVRLFAAATLAAMGVPTSNLRRRLEVGTSLAPGLNDLFTRRLLPVDPYDAADMADFEASLSKATGVEAATLLHQLASVAENSAPGVTELLLRACGHPETDVRVVAADGLAVHRDAGAVAELKRLLAAETDPAFAGMLARALVASGAERVADLNAPSRFPEVVLWRCVLAGRARDVAATAELVEVATDAGAPFSLRRAAIWASGRLPFAAALEGIAPIVLANPLLFDFDDHEMRAHQGLINVLQSGLLDVVGDPPGTLAFVGKVRSFLDNLWVGDLFPLAPDLMPRAAQWVSDQLGPGQLSPANLLRRLGTPVLYAAVFRALASCGETGLLEEQFLAARNHWIARKALVRLVTIHRRNRSSTAGLATLVSRSHFPSDPILRNIVREVTPTGEAPSPPTTTSSVTWPVHRVTGQQAEDVLHGGSLACAGDAALLLTDTDAGTYERLVILADPILDRDSLEVSYRSDVALNPDGASIVRTIRTSSTAAPDPRARLRPAIAAANSRALSIPWHEAAVTARSSERYIDGLLASLAAQGEAARFYDELARFEPFLLPRLCQHGLVSPVERFFDARLVPVLSRHSAAGDSAMFETLCCLAARLTGPEIDPVLDHLLSRFVDYLTAHDGTRPADRDHHPWRGFNALVKHPRFERIPQWRARLARILASPLAWFHGETVATVLARHRGSYATLESRFIEAPDWQDFVFDRIDQLDGFVERLWHPLPTSATHQP